jgi:signal transduction histidine kinase/CheY-like chemotaxis protein
MPSPGAPPQAHALRNAVPTNGITGRRGGLKIQWRPRPWGAAGAAFVVAMAAAGLVEWVEALPWSTPLGRGAVAMRPDTSLGLLAAGAGTLLRLWERPLASLASRSLGAFAIALSMLAGLVWSLNLDPAQAPVVARLLEERHPVASPYVMAPIAITALFAAGLQLAWGSTRYAWYRDLASGWIVFVGLLGCTAHVVGARFPLGTVLPFAALALPSAIAMTLLGVSLWLTGPTRGMLAVTVSDSAGGYMARRLLPTAILLPLAVGVLATAAQHAGHLSDDTRAALMMMTGSVGLAGVALVTTRSLDRLDRERSAVRDDLAEREARLALALEREQEATRRAQEADRRKDLFLAVLGHELRNPLSPLLTALELLRLKGRSGDLEWEVIERQARHLSRLVDDLLDVSRVAAGRVTLRLAPVELARVVEQAIEMTVPLIEERRHVLEVAVPQTGLIIDADGGRMAQVVGNLLANAAKYTDPGGTIRIEGQACNGDVQLRVRDNGQGLDPDLAPRIFEVFVQAPRPIDRAEGGLGLGLAIVRSLVELHGGGVEARSDGPGTGTEVVVRLRRSKALHAPSPVPAPSDRAARPTRVLVVDDNQDAADILGLTLRARGHVVEVAYDGPSALTVLEHFAPEVALLDIGLPAMDGYELAERIRGHANGRDAHLIAVTGYGRDADRVRSMDAGFDLHLVKPIEAVRLEASMDAVLGRPLRPRSGARPRAGPPPRSSG